MNRDPGIWIEDALDELQYIQKMFAGRTMREFLDDGLAYRAAVYGILKITEATRHIPPELLKEHPSIPWPAMFAMGNRIRHEYFRLDEDRIWQVVTVDLPELRIVLEKIQSRLTPI